MIRRRAATAVPGCFESLCGVVAGVVPATRLETHWATISEVAGTSPAMTREERRSGSKRTETALESEGGQPGFCFGLTKFIGPLVPLLCTLPITDQAESAKRPKSVWIVCGPKRQRRLSAAKFNRPLVDSPRTNDIAFPDQPIGFYQEILGSCLIWLWDCR